MEATSHTSEMWGDILERSISMIISEQSYDDNPKREGSTKIKVFSWMMRIDLMVEISLMVEVDMIKTSISIMKGGMNQPDSILYCTSQILKGEYSPAIF